MNVLTLRSCGSIGHRSLETSRQRVVNERIEVETWAAHDDGAALADPTRRAILARLNATALAPAANWINGYRQFWDNSFDALELHLTPMAKDTPK